MDQRSGAADAVPHQHNRRRDDVRHRLHAQRQKAESACGDWARRYGELAVKARVTGRGFRIPDGYIAAIAPTHGFAVATRDASAFKAAGLKAIDSWGV